VEGTFAPGSSLHQGDGEDPRLLEYEDVFLDDVPAFRQKLFDLTGGWTVPQIVIDGKPIGGYAELWRLERDGLLDEGVAA
jgi:glutaredoxin 3